MPVRCTRYLTMIFFPQVNTLAGLTPNWSDLPELAKAQGISFDRLLELIIDSALKRRSSWGIPVSTSLHLKYLACMFVMCWQWEECAKDQGEPRCWLHNHVIFRIKGGNRAFFSSTLTAAVANSKNCNSNSFSVVRDRVFVGRADKRTDRTQLSRSIFQAHASIAHQRRNGRSLTMQSLYTLCTTYLHPNNIAYTTYCTPLVWCVTRSFFLARPPTTMVSEASPTPITPCPFVVE